MKNVNFYQWGKNFFCDKKSFFLIALNQPRHFSDWSLAIINVDFPEFFWNEFLINDEIYENWKLHV